MKRIPYFLLLILLAVPGLQKSVAQSRCKSVQLKIYPTNFHANTVGSSFRRPSAVFKVKYTIYRKGYNGQQDTILFSTSDECYIKKNVTATGVYPLALMNQKADPFYTTLCFEGSIDLSNYWIRIESYGYGYANCCTQKQIRKNKNPRCDGVNSNQYAGFSTVDMQLTQLNQQNSINILHTDNDPEFSFRSYIQKTDVAYPLYSIPEEIQVCTNLTPYVLKLPQYTYNLSLTYFPTKTTTISKWNGASWNTVVSNSANTEYTLNSAGRYAVFTVLNNDCQMADTFNLTYIDTPFVQSTYETKICQSGTGTITLNEQSNYVSYLWQDIWGNCLSRYRSLTVEDTGVYTVKVTASNGCYSRRAFPVTYNNNEVIRFAQNQVRSCFKTSNNITIQPANASSFTSFLWSTGATTSTLNISRTGYYRLKATDNAGCVSYATVAVVDTCLVPIESDAHVHRSVVRLEKPDFNDPQKNTISLTDPRTVPNSIPYGSNDIVKKKFIVRLQYHRNQNSDWRDSIWSMYVPYQFTLDNNTMEYRTLYIKKTNAQQDIYESIAEHSSGNTANVTVDYAHIAILDRNGNSLTMAQIPDDINLELELQCMHVPEFVPATALAESGISHTCDNTNKKISLQWLPLKQAFEYEVQLVFIDEMDKDYTITPAVFKARGWSQLTSANSYSFDATFPSGKIAYRICPVGRITEFVNGNYNHIINGQWSAIHEIPINNNAALHPFEIQKNWSKVATFAEEGKKKEVVSYMDGLLRNQQVVTNLNSEKLSLVAETYYDHESRGTMNVLPVPLADNNLKFKPGLALKNGAPIDKSFVDNPVQLPLDISANSAAAYYSPSNTFSAFNNKVNMNALPQAEGYVTTKVEYSRDNTGRIVKQSGVGKEFCIDDNGDKHFTQYFYTTPNQSELHRLFGSNVGQAVFYTKQVVVDPNGQVSVNYLNNSEKTVATALSGDAPAQVDTLPKPVAEVFPFNLSGNNIRDSLGKLSQSVNIIINDVVNKSYEFHYNATTGRDNGINNSYCKDCKYSLTLSVAKPNGLPVPLTASNLPAFCQPVYNAANEIIMIKATLDAALCNVSTTYAYPDIQFTAVFDKIGNYTYTKKLVLLDDDETSIQNYLTAISFPPLNTFIQNNIGNYIDSLACRDDCPSRLSVYLRDLRRDDSLKNSIRTQVAYNAIRDSMVNAGLCDPFTAAQYDASDYALKRCDDLFNNMVRQISPNEKYFNSVYDRFIIVLNGNLPIQQTRRDSLIKWGIIRTSSAGNANSKDSVIARWSPETARKVLLLFKGIIHPEYCHYENCIGDTAFNAFSIRMGLMSGFQEALAKGYISAAGSSESNTRSYNFGSLINQDIAQLSAAGIAINSELDEYIRFRGGYLLQQPNVNAAHVNELTVLQAVKPRTVYWSPAYLSQPDSGYNTGFLYYRDSMQADINHNGVINTAEWDSLFWIRFSVAYQAARAKAIAKFHAVTCPYLDDPEALVKNPAISVAQAHAQMSSYTTTAGYCTTCADKPALWADMMGRECPALLAAYTSVSGFKQAVTDSLRNICYRNCGQTNPLALITHNMVVNGQLTPLLNFIHSILGTADTCQLADILDSGIEYHYATDSAGNLIITYVCEDQPCSVNSIIDIANHYRFTYPHVDSVLYYEGFNAGMNTVLVADPVYLNHAQTNGLILNTPSARAYIDSLMANFILLPICGSDSNFVKGLKYVNKFYDATGDSMGYYLLNFTLSGNNFNKVFWRNPVAVPVQYGNTYQLSYSLALQSFPNVDIVPVVESYSGTVVYSDTLFTQKEQIACEAVWNRYNFFWSPRANTDSMRLIMLNRESRSWGNDFAFDEVRIELVTDTVLPQLGCAGVKPYKYTITPAEITTSYAACNNTSTGGGLYTLFFTDSLGNRVKNVKTLGGKRYENTLPFSPLPVYALKSVAFTHYSYLAALTDGSETRVFVFEASCALPNWNFVNDNDGCWTNWSDLDLFELNALRNNYLNAGSNYACQRSFDTCILRPQQQTDSFTTLPCERSYECLNAQWQPDTSFQSCIDRQIRAQTGWLTQLYTDSLNTLLTAYQRTHIANCFKALSENFYYKAMLNEYHYTLYYYDQQGNLVQTIPPKGVYPVPQSGFTAAGVWLGAEPKHVLQSVYQYNTRNQPVAQHSTDGGLTKYWYNKKGLLRLSQNAKQRWEITGKPRFSFTQYDALGRVILVGEIETPNNFGYVSNSANAALKDTIYKLIENPVFPTNYVNVSGYTLSQLVKTEYDQPMTLPGMKQDNLHNRVSATYAYDTYAKMLAGDGIATLYSYDEVGNVKTMVQDLSKNTALANLPQNAAPEQLTKRVDYAYDLQSGKVNAVVFNHGKQDEFRHSYAYDADNRITTVYTADKTGITHEDARYYYYPHGPLARVEYGNELVQSTDYAYTLQGWLKGINALKYTQTLNSAVGAPQVMSVLGYYKNDFSSIDNTFSDNTAFNAFAPWYAAQALAKNRGLYNGNIAYMLTDLRGLRQNAADYAPNQGSNTSVNNTLLGMQYRYDQLNRIVKADGRTPKIDKLTQQGSTVGTFDDGLTGQYHSSGSLYNAYKTNYAFDANGNITFLNRYALNFSAGKLEMMDSLTYIYAKDNNGASSNNGKMYNNRLYQVQDKQSVAARFATDIDDQGALSYALTYPTAGMPNTNLTALGSSNYQYDLTGQLVKDNAEKISTIKWTVYGKVSEVVYTAAANKPDLKFVYDATGNRVAKILRKVDKTADSTVQYYFRDAQGNPLDIVQPVVSNNIYTENHEYNLYGSQRIGTYNSTLGFVANNNLVLERVLGKRQYELSNHLGNVLTTITDQKYRVSNVSTDYLYQPIVTSATDYFPFGMQMPGRTYNLADKYRFGFNGMENDDEVAGKGRHPEFGDFGYDPATGRRWNRDPVFKPMISPYATFGNNPILYSDPSGYDWFGSKDGKTSIYRNSSEKTYTTEDGQILDNTGTTHISSSTLGDVTTNAYYVQNELVHIETIDNSKSKSENSLANSIWFAGAGGAKASVVRTTYALATASLYPRFKMKANSTGNDAFNYKGSATRNKYVLKAREYTPEPYLSAAEDLKASGSLALNPNGRYWYTNFKVNAFNGGILLLNVYGAYKSYQRIENSPDKVPALLDEAGNWAAGWYGASIASRLPGSPVQKIGYGFVGSVLGVVTKNTIQEMIMNYNEEVQRKFTPFSIITNDCPSDNTRTPLTPPDCEVGE